MAGENSQAARGLPEGWSPVKTPEGRAEISSRSRALNQRQRTVLLLVDGQRTISQIRHVAAQVGASDTCLDDLLDMGLVALPAVVAAPLAPVIAPVAAPVVPAAPVSVAAPPVVPAVAAAPSPLAPTTMAVPIPIRAAAAPVPEAPVRAPRTAAHWSNTLPALPQAVQSIALTDITPTAFVPPVAPVITIHDTLPPTLKADAEAESARRLTSELFDEFVRANEQHDDGPTTMGASLRGGRIDSMMSSLYPLIESAFGALGGGAAAETQDEALEEARRILMREVRAKAPVTGALTLMKLRRAATREDLIALFDEVGTHIAIPMRRLSTQQTLLHVRALLERPM